MASALTARLSHRVPRLSELIGAAAVEAWWEGLRAVYLWQVERDLELLTRHVGWPGVAGAYRTPLRNPNELFATAYELRTAAKLAPVVDGLELRPRVSAGACDLAVRLAGQRVFLEVTTRDDVFPWQRGGRVEDPPLTARETIHREFRTTTPDQLVPTRDVPASEELRQAITREVGQLPRGEFNVVVLGTPNSKCLDVETALFGDERFRSAPRSDLERVAVANGLFAVADEEGGLSELSAVVWLRLRHNGHDIRTHGRSFLNPKARHPLPPGIENVFRRVFDRTSVLEEELQRITRVLVEQYRAERILLFGSLAREFPADGVHDASDIDLAVVKPTTARFVDRLREAVDLVEPRVGLNLLVYTPEEIAQAQSSGRSFVRDEILARGKLLFPADG
ncbi:MAG TPA: nucleotidyltransferase domain-containing protein [Methylomirabilota bacterium]|jgi:predicted nucleotidyltransferase|nr:nucleotidyltransferase domain-containing protein [Methylomirabilota bacterium]